MKTQNVCFISLLLIGCTAFAPKVVEVKVPVYMICVTDIPARPDFITNENLIKMNKGNFVYALSADRLSRINYIGELEAVIEGCK